MSVLRIDPLTGLRSLVPDGDGVLVGLDPVAADPARDGVPDLFAAQAARGVVESLALPAGMARLADLDAAGTTALLAGAQAAMQAHAEAACLHVALTDDGSATRAQVFALPFVPAAVARERERFGAYAVRTMGGNLQADLLQEEVRRRERIVAIDDEAVLLCPYASRVPHQLMLLPRDAGARFQDARGTGGALLHDGLRRLALVRGGTAPGFDAWIRTAPSGAEHFAWRIDLLPRPDRGDASGADGIGALTVGTGLAVSGLAPEAAAAALRAA